MKKIVLLLCFICICFEGHCKTKSWNSKELSAIEHERIFVLLKMSNYIHYFYPAEELQQIQMSPVFDRHRFLFYSIKEIEKCDTDESFIKTLYKLFSPVCPDLIINDSIGNFTDRIKPADNSSFYVRRNQIDPWDFGLYINSSIEKVDSLRNNYPIPDSLYTFKINDKVKISFPMALSVMPQKTKEYTQLMKQCRKISFPAFSTPWWWKVISKKGKTIVMNRYEDRLANEIARYGFIQYFYPYYFEDNLHETWDSVYYEHIGKVAACADIKSFYDNICETMHHVKDSHTHVNFNGLATAGGKHLVSLSNRSLYPEIETVIQDKSLFIKHIGDSLNSYLKPGDKIIAVNDQNTEDLIEEKLQRLSYSHEMAGLSKLSSSGSILECDAASVFNPNPTDTTLVLTVQREFTDTFSVAIKPTSKTPFSGDTLFFKMLADSICYVNVCGEIREYDSFKEIIPTLLESRGIVFDMRGYPGGMIIPILAHLTDSILSLGNIQRSLLYFPDPHKKEFVQTDGSWSIAPALSPQSEEIALKYQHDVPEKIRIDKPVVFLANANAISFAETMLDIIKTYKIGPIIGEPSAGCNGDAVFCSLPYASFMMTGYKFMNRDNSQHHGIGVLPDIYVKNKDFNTDKQLITAIDYINEKAGTNN